MTDAPHLVDAPHARPHRVVVVGGGFAGLRAVRGLARAQVDITLIDRHNYHCFQPLLYQVATSGLSPGLIASPLRWILRRQRNVRVVLERATEVDVGVRVIVGEDLDGVCHNHPFDTLIVATGATHAWFGHDAEWGDMAPGLKTIDDALEIRRRILAAFERAEVAADAGLRQRAVTFVVVGAGPTGVELAGQIAEMARRTLRREYRAIDPASTRTVLVDAADRPLGAYSIRLSRRAERSLRQLGVELRLNAVVHDIDRHGVTLLNETDRIHADTIIWAAGVQAGEFASALAKGTDTATDSAGRLEVDDHLRLARYPHVYVLGDMAATGLPGTAPVAIQQGRWAARAVRAQLTGRDVPPFCYRDKGMMATIGRHRAVVAIGRLELSGVVAWLMWLFVHLMYTVGFANRFLVLVRWAIAYFSHGRGERALTGRRP